MEDYNLLIWQRRPLKPFGHEQPNESPFLAQVPPFLHGFGLQTTTKRDKEYIYLDRSRKIQLFRLVTSPSRGITRRYVCPKRATKKQCDL